MESIEESLRNSKPKLVVVENLDEIDKSNPIFQKMSQVNGKINSMNLEDLQNHLKQLGLENSGSMESCRKRLKIYRKAEILSQICKKPSSYYYDVICVIDFEATCDRYQSHEAIQEIIEFPAIAIETQTRKIISSFHEYVKPTQSTFLTPFCVQLTGIQQSDIDKADSFVQVLHRFETWLYGIIKSKPYSSFSLLSDGSWDFGHFFARQCQISKIKYPSYAKRWINLKRVFSNYYKTQMLTLEQMLSYLGLQFQGRLHCGLDDAKNIAHLLIRLLVDGANPVVNERISWHQFGRQRWGNMLAGYVKVFYNKPSNDLNISDSDDSFDEKWSISA